MENHQAAESANVESTMSRGDIQMAEICQAGPSESGRPLRILYAAGPGDVLGTYRHWREGRDDPSQIAVAYSAQFYDACRDLDACGFVIASNGKPGRLREGRFTITHRPIWFSDGPAALYHLSQVWTSCRLIVSALAFRADAAVVSSGSGHWFPLAVLPLLGVMVIPTLHCTLWRKHHPPTGVGWVIHKLNARFFARSAFAVLTVSRDISRQIADLTEGRCSLVFEFLPLYRPGTFPGQKAPSARRPFRVLFAGRVEKNKGVYDLLAIARRFADAGRTDIEFDLCGDGTALADLRRRTEGVGLGGRFRCHGPCGRAVLREMYTRAHAVIVPTTTDFIEGFNKVVAEGVLAGRPVVTSSVCPALDYVRGAVVEVAPDDVRGYGDAVLKLCDDEFFYRDKCLGCAAARPPFYNPDCGWAVALKKAVTGLRRKSRRPRLAADLDRRNFKRPP